MHTFTPVCRGKDPHSYQPQATIVCASTPASSTQQPESWVVSGLVTKPKLTTTPEKRKRREKSSKSRKSSRKHPPEDVAKSSAAAEDTDCFQVWSLMLFNSFKDIILKKCTLYKHTQSGHANVVYVRPLGSITEKTNSGPGK